MRTLCLFITLLALDGCNSNTDITGNRSSQTVQDTPSPVEVKSSRLKELSQELIGQKVESFPKIIPDFQFPESGCIVFMYSGYNCDTCIGMGFDMMNNFKESGISPSLLWVIGSDSDIGSMQVLHHYPEMIYADTNNIVRRELKYLYTPVMFLFDNMGQIVDVFFPSTTYDKADLHRFQEHALSQCT